MNKFEHLKMTGCKCDGVVIELTPFTVIDDRRNIVIVLLGEYDGLVCAGYDIHCGEYDRKVFPNPENGRYKTEQDAKVYILALILEYLKNILPPEILAIVRLALAQCRQAEMF